MNFKRSCRVKLLASQKMAQVRWFAMHSHQCSGGLNPFLGKGVQPTQVTVRQRWSYLLTMRRQTPRTSCAARILTQEAFIYCCVSM
jgi:hypothetical protein